MEGKSDSGVESGRVAFEGKRLVRTGKRLKQGREAAETEPAACRLCLRLPVFLFQEKALRFIVGENVEAFTDFL